MKEGPVAVGDDTWALQNKSRGKTTHHDSTGEHVQDSVASLERCHPSTLIVDQKC